MAKLRYNPKHTAIEVTVGQNTWTEEIKQDDESIMLHHENGAVVVVLEHADLEGLTPNTIYELVKTTTILEQDAEVVMQEEDLD